MFKNLEWKGRRVRQLWLKDGFFYRRVALYYVRIGKPGIEPQMVCYSASVAVSAEGF